MPENVSYIKTSDWNEKKHKECFKYFNFIIFLIENPKIRGLRNVDLLQELPFYDEPGIYETLKAFGWYAKSYKVEIVDWKDPLLQLEASKSTI